MVVSKVYKKMDIKAIQAVVSIHMEVSFFSSKVVSFFSPWATFESFHVPHTAVFDQLI